MEKIYILPRNPVHNFQHGFVWKHIDNGGAFKWDNNKKQKSRREYVFKQMDQIRADVIQPVLFCNVRYGA